MSTMTSAILATLGLTLLLASAATIVVWRRDLPGPFKVVVVCAVTSIGMLLFSTFAHIMAMVTRAS